MRKMPGGENTLIQDFRSIRFVRMLWKGFSEKAIHW